MRRPTPSTWIRFLFQRRFVKAESANGTAYASRSVYFDGENLLVYQPDKTAVDQVTPGVTASPDVGTGS